MIVKIINTVLQDTYTSDELTERIGIMREHYGAKAFTPSEKDKSVQDRYGATIEPYTLNVLERWERVFTEMKLTPKELYEIMDEIEEEVSTIPSAILYVPIHFSSDYIAGFGKWLRENTKPNLLLTVRTDSRVSGGCAVIWNNTYYDFSMKYFVKAHRQSLVEMVKKTINA